MHWGDEVVSQRITVPPGISTIIFSGLSWMWANTEGEGGDNARSKT